MGNVYIDKYYDHFSKNIYREPPAFEVGRNYMMRFNTKMHSYHYDNNNLTIIYFNKGFGSLEWHNKCQNVDNDSFIVTNPSDGWSYLNEIDDRIDVLSIVVSKKLKKEFDTYYFSKKDALIDNPFYVENQHHFFIEKTLSADHYPCGKLLKQLYGHSFDSCFDFLDAEEIAMAVLNSLYNNQFRAYRLASTIEVKKKSTQVETLKRLLVAREYIHDNLDKKVAFDELVTISCLSKFHLYNSFKLVFGKTPHQYANYIKLLKAKELLMAKNSSVSEVSADLGFSDVHGFSKLFKKFYNSSPSAYIRLP